MARSKPSKRLSQAEIERFLVAAEALHLSIIKPFISPHCDHYRQTRVLHEVLLRAVREVTGKDATFIRWNLTGPAQQGPEPPAEEPIAWSGTDQGPEPRTICDPGP